METLTLEKWKAVGPQSATLVTKVHQVVGVQHKLVTDVITKITDIMVVVLVLLILQTLIAVCLTTIGVGVQDVLHSSGMLTVHLLGMAMVCTFVKDQRKG
jgi:hypothetical protein